VIPAQRAGNAAIAASREGGYPEWARSFAAHFVGLHPNASPRVDETLDRWCSYYGKLSPEETAELAAGVWPNGCTPTAPTGDLGE
jgi:hypothetical protein